MKFQAKNSFQERSKPGFILNNLNNAEKSQTLLLLDFSTGLRFPHFSRKKKQERKEKTGQD